MPERVRLLDQQPVHIGAQADRLAARAVAQHSDHTGLAEPARDFDAQRFHLPRNDVGRAVLFVAQLRMRVKVAAKRPNADVGMCNSGMISWNVLWFGGRRTVPIESGRGDCRAGLPSKAPAFTADTQCGQ